MIVAVGSTNPTKVDPVKEVFSKHFKGVKVIGVQVPSGVREQPLSDDETYEGALNRARAALKATKGAEYGVGVEGGLHENSYGWLERAIVVIVNKKGDIGIGASGGVVLSGKVMDGIHAGKTMGDVIDEIFETKNIGQGKGMFGLLTNDTVTRAEAMKHGIAFALGRFLHPKIY